MLGSADHPTVQKLMRLIETQNKQTLAAWAVDYVAAHDLPILIAHGGDSAPFSRAIEGVRAHLAGRLPLKELKPLLKEASNAARSETDPIVQASARALGFSFYSAAANAYHQAGLTETAQTYDRLADAEFENILASLQAAAVPDEPNPVKIDWNC